MTVLSDMADRERPVGQSAAGSTGKSSRLTTQVTEKEERRQNADEC